MKSAGGSRKLAAGTWISSKPELTIHVETLTNEAFYYFGKDPGAGGLPVGVSGRVVCLLSGGIDSPVAAWRLMRRGCRVHFVHFHSYPILSRASQEKARELVRLLTNYQFRSRLFLVPFGEIQQQVVLSVAPPLRVVIYRRLMMRIAEAIAVNNRAGGLVTGEVVGQVASQTLENLTAINAVATLPVLRPLIGMDKDEITAEARTARHLSHLDHPGSGLLHAFHPQASGDEGAHGRRSPRRERAASRRNCRSSGGCRVRGALRVSCNKMTSSLRHHLPDLPARGACRGCI